MAINTKFIKDNVLTQYQPNLKRVSKRKFTYQNECVGVSTGIDQQTFYGKSVLNGSLNWRCYSDYEDTFIYVIDDGSTIIHHGHEASLPLSLFDIIIEGNNSGYIHEDNGKIFIRLFFNVNIENLDVSGIYEDDIRSEHIAGLNYLLSPEVSQIDNVQENYFEIYFNNSVNRNNAEVYVKNYIGLYLRPNIASLAINIIK